MRGSKIGSTSKHSELALTVKKCLTACKGDRLEAQLVRFGIHRREVENILATTDLRFLDRLMAKVLHHIENGYTSYVSRH